MMGYSAFRVKLQRFYKTDCSLLNHLKLRLCYNVAILNSVLFEYGFFICIISDIYLAFLLNYGVY